MEKVFLYPQAQYEPDQIREVAREIISGSGVDPRGRTVFIKPSFVYPSHTPETVGVVTQPAFIRGVCLAFNDMGARRVLVGEDSVLGPSRAAFYAMGIYPYIHGIATPVYFDEERHIRVEVPDPRIQGSFVVPAIWPEADLFVSLPKIKVNQFAKVTLSVKNNLGFQRQADRCKNHSDGKLQEKIADLYRVRPPDLVLADSIVAGEGQGPMLARPVELGVMIGGSNGIAVDSVACRLMGIDPFQIEHLNYLREAGIGPVDPRDVEVVGSRVDDFARAFDRPTTELKGAHENLRVFEGEEKCCQYGCRGMVRCALDAWLERKDVPIKEMTVVIGKGVGDLPLDLDPRKTLVVGDCAEEHKGAGTFLPGCPPLPMDTAFILQRFQGFVPSHMKMRDVFKGYVAGYGWKAARFFRGYDRPLDQGE
jgi:uncharacterized protein (DUF362 family)